MRTWRREPRKAGPNWEPAEPTPDYQEAPPAAFNGTREEWESLTPGMRRKIFMDYKRLGK